MVLAGGESRQNATMTYENIKLATPTAPRVFTGRDNLVTEGVEMLCKKGQAHLAILGAGGMGKTSLALHVMEHADVRKKFQEKRYFLPCEVLPDAPSLIQGLLQILKISISEGKDGYEILESYLQSSQEPILLVLDNFETPWYSSENQKAIQNLIEKIHDQGKVSIILTMRGGKAVGDIEWDKLGGKSGLPPLTLRAAREAFLSISPATKESEELDALLNELDCMPLAVFLMAQLSKRLPLEVLIKNWAKSKTDMLRNENQDSRLTSMNTSIDLSLNMLASQESGSIRILPLLAYLPNGVPFWTLNLPQLSPDIGNDLEMTILAMIDSGLIYEESTSLRMLSPIREYVQTKYPVTQHHLDQISSFYVQLLQNLPQSKLEAQDILEVHTANISTIFTETAPQQGHLEAIYCFSKFTKFYPQTLPILEKALTQEWNGEQQEHINIRFLKARIMQWMGYHKQAILEIQKIETTVGDAKSRRRYLPNEAQDGWKTEAEILAKCDKEMGVIYYRQSEYSQAVEKFTDAKTQFENIGNELGVADCLHKLGEIHCIQSQYSQAVEKLTDARTQFDKIGDHRGATQCLQRLGDLHSMKNEYSQAVEKLTNARTLFEKIGDQLGAAQCLGSLGHIHYMRGEYPQAIEKLTDAKIQFEKIGDQLGAAQCLRSLGDVHYMQGEYPRAMEKLTNAKIQFEKIGHQLGAAQCLRSLGDVHYMQGEYPRAMEKLTDARSQFEKIGDQLGAAQCLTRLGNIHYDQGEYPQAMEKFTDARTQFEKIGNQLWAACCLQSLGDTHYMQCEYPEAIEKLTNAKNLFEKIGNQNRAAECLESLDYIQLKLSMSPTL
ncbi:TPR-like protein [Gymnopus androsaceus JB14]|uniref:TPR-like protein n=1 Tax=Gymnopus androsaceus JB14 TaxID=1447944 RepID=A0A6A4IEG1_9AGAR|nr:TPR-like protein [Gymnopus androsaceus JB14]